MGKLIYNPQELRALARKLDRTNNCTPCHSENVANYALELCKALKIRGKKKDMIIAASLIHDVGKIGIDTRIWAKGQRLSSIEWLKIKMHPIISARLVKEAGFSKEVVEAIYYHHVWFNGNGYPTNARKKGSRIPISARIIAVCDSYEAMVSERPYRKAMIIHEAIRILRKYSAKQFDPRIVEIFIAELLKVIE